MDIVSLPIEHDKEKIDSRFRLVIIASQRAKELSLGVKPKIKTRGKKATTMAIEEAIDSKLEFLIGDDAKAAKEEAKKFDFRKLLEERKREAIPEDLSELEKDLKVYLHEKEDVKRTFEDLFADTRDKGVEETEE